MTAKGICHKGCHELATQCAMENFEDDRGFSIYDLSLWGEEPSEVHWDTITPLTRFETAYAYMQRVGAEYLADGTASCYQD